MQVRIIPKILHFKKPAGTSRGVYHTRKVWYILIQKDNRFGIGECAPLPNLSCDDLENYTDLLTQSAHQLLDTDNFDLASLRDFPSMLFGLETALLQLEKNTFTLSNTPFANGKQGIPINGLVWMGTSNEMAKQIEEKIKQGFRCIKLKIGAIDFLEELKLLRGIRHRFSADEIELRVDANGAFSPANVMDKLERLAELEIHSIEQPLPPGKMNQMDNLLSDPPISIALDEELIGTNTPQEKRSLLDSIHPQYIVLKPSLHGGMCGCREWIAEARQRGIGWWITSALESNIGLNAIAHFCASIISPIDSQTLPQGLGTGQLFLDNIPLPLEIDQARLWFHSEKEPDIHSIIQTVLQE